MRCLLLPLLRLAIFGETLSITGTRTPLNWSNLLLGNNNSTDKFLYDWGPPPYRIQIAEDIEVVIDSYGRLADSKLKPHVVEGIQEVAAFFQDEKSLRHVMHADYGIVHFALGLTGRISITGMTIFAILMVMQDLYSFERWKLTEITSAQILIQEGAIYVPSGAFQILFREPFDRTN